MYFFGPSNSITNLIILGNSSEFYYHEFLVLELKDRIDTSWPLNVS